jgi:hypothetical protein
MNQTVLLGNKNCTVTFRPDRNKATANRPRQLVARSWPRSTENWFARCEVRAASGKTEQRSSPIRCSIDVTDNGQVKGRGLLGRGFDKSNRMWAPQGPTLTH